jgi:hypothetical protein
MLPCGSYDTGLPRQWFVATFVVLMGSDRLVEVYWILYPLVLLRLVFGVCHQFLHDVRDPVDFYLLLSRGTAAEPVPSDPASPGTAFHEPRFSPPITVYQSVQPVTTGGPQP